MSIWVWANFTLLFLAGGLTPGPAVILVTTASIRYGFWASMAPAAGICAANLVQHRAQMLEKFVRVFAHRKMPQPFHDRHFCEIGRAHV